MIKFIAGILFCCSLTGLSQDRRDPITHDFRDHDLLQVGDDVLIISKNASVKVAEVDDGNVIIKLGVPLPKSDRTFKREEVARRLDCYGQLCTPNDAIDTQGNIYRVYEIYENDQVRSVIFRGGRKDKREFLPPKDIDVKNLFASCQCIQNLCKGDTIVGENGKEYRISYLFQNGQFAYQDQAFSWIPLRVKRLQSIGAGSFLCTNERPCNCDK